MELNQPLKTLWFFRTLDEDSNYLFCSDGTLYSKPRHKRNTTVVIKPVNTSRQGYSRLYLKSNGKRIIKSVTGLLIKYFPLSKVNKAIALNDPYCPF